MEIIGVRDKVPTKAVLREKGSYHADVIAVIKSVEEEGVTATRIPDAHPKSNQWDGEFVVFRFEDERTATVRAGTLRKAGYVAVVRNGVDVYASKPAAGEVVEDEDEEDDDE